MGEQIGRLLLWFVARQLDDEGWEIFIEHSEEAVYGLSSLTGAFNTFLSQSGCAGQVMSDEQDLEAMSRKEIVSI
jgi:hypothetical protein